MGIECASSYFIKIEIHVSESIDAIQRKLQNTYRMEVFAHNNRYGVCTQQFFFFPFNLKAKHRVQWNSWPSKILFSDW